MSGIASPAPGSNWNVPNGLSAIRLILSFLVFYWIEVGVFFPALIVFIIAVSTDWIDGWWARRYNQITKLGRILDPFVDKIIICGSMIALTSYLESPLRPWMATLVVGRELLVTSLRGMIEGKGGDFSAKQLGKWKMVAQCAAIIMVLLLLMKFQTSMLVSYPQFLRIATIVVIYISILLTIASAIEYVLIAVRKSKG